MISIERQKTAMFVTLILLGLNLLAFQVLISGWSTARMDLTKDRIYSISPATERLLTSLDEEILILGYFSGKTHPKLSPLVPEIADMLDEYRAISGGKVHIEIIDPGEDETAEQIANDRYGVRSTPFRLASKYETGIVNAYFALVVKYGDQYVRYGFADLIQVDPLPDGDVEVKLKNLEYDLTRAIKKAAFGFHSTADLFESVEGPVRFTAIMSPATFPEIFSETPEIVRSAAAELEESSSGRFEYEEIDPTVDQSVADDVFQQYGARPMSLGLFGGEQFYLYGILQVGDQFEQVPLTTESLTAADVREAVENSLRRHTPGFLKRVGLVTPGPDLPPDVMRQLQMQGQQMPPPEFEQIRAQLGQDYEVERVNMQSEAGIPSEIDVLLVVEPRNFNERAVYNLDQYLMRGGRLVLCISQFKVDFGQEGLTAIPQSSGLDGWLDHMGVEIASELVLDEQNQPLPIPQTRQTVLGLIRTWQLVPYPYLVAVKGDGLVNRQVTGGLETVGIYWGSPVSVRRDSLNGVEVFDLLRSSDRSWTSTDLSGVTTVDYTVPESGTEPQLLAVALSGVFDSYYQDRQPPARIGGGNEEGPTTTDPPLHRSPDTRIAIVGNAAFLSDLVARILSQADGGFFEENLRFIENLIDWSVQDNDLVTIRSRGVTIPRLENLENEKEAAIEAVNYLAPAVLLIAFGSLRIMRRRKTPSLLDTGSFGESGPPAPPGPESES